MQAIDNGYFGVNIKILVTKNVLSNFFYQRNWGGRSLQTTDCIANKLIA